MFINYLYAYKHVTKIIFLSKRVLNDIFLEYCIQNLDCNISLTPVSYLVHRSKGYHWLLFFLQIEYMIIKLDHKKRKARLSLRGSPLLEELRKAEEHNPTSVYNIKCWTLGQLGLCLTLTYHNYQLGYNSSSFVKFWKKLFVYFMLYWWGL